MRVNKNMETTWTEVGKRYNETEEQRKLLSEIFDRVEWWNLEVGSQMAYESALVIKEAISLFNIPLPTHFAISRELAPLELIALQAVYGNGIAKIYIISDGVNIIPLRSDFHSKEEIENHES